MPSEIKSHTPAPWRYEASTKTIRAVPENYWLATMDSWDGAVNHDANARLIAASPELLAELRELSAQFDALLTAHGKAFGWGFLTTQKARELIARIDGTPTAPTPSLPPVPSVEELRERADKLGSRFASDARIGCWNYYDRQGSHAFCVSLREVAELIASDENSRAAV